MKRALRWIVSLFVLALYLTACSSASSGLTIPDFEPPVTAATPTGLKSSSASFINFLPRFTNLFFPLTANASANAALADLLSHGLSPRRHHDLGDGHKGDRHHRRQDDARS